MKKNLDFHRLLAGPIKVALCALCAALALFASGCSGEDTTPSSVAIVASNVSNQEVYPYELLGDALTETASTGGWVDVLIADGHPRTVLEGGVQSAAASSTAAQVRATQAQAIAEAFVNEAAGAQAQCAETDVLGGLSAAAASLAQAPGSHTVHLFSSLLSTAGVVNLAEHPEWVSAPAGSDITSEELHARVVEQLKPLLPGMSCVSKVVIYGAGVTAGDQAAPNTAQTNDLKDLWSQILLACGVGEVQYVTAPLSGKETEGAYPVSTVELPQVTVDVEIPQAPEPEPDPEPSEPGGSTGDSTVDSWAARIDAYLAGSTLSGYGRVFAQAALAYGVDPRWSPAISCIESTMGAYCFRPYNAWGWMGHSFSSWEEAIWAHVEYLGYMYGGKLTMDAANIYCDPGEEWYYAVLGEMESI